jgi:hypothetical protein
MALGSDQKLYIAVGILALLGGALFLQNKKAKDETKAHAYESVAEALPKLTVTDDDVKSLTKVVLEAPAKKEGDEQKPAVKNVLVKDGETWKLDEPVKALANQANVESLLKNLKSLKVQERLPGDDLKKAYEQYELTEDKALHAAFYAGGGMKYEFWFGKSGGRGQTVRIGGKDGVFLIDGYSPFLYGRDTKGWRDLTIFKFEDASAKQVDIKNEHGTYEFKKDGDAWKAKFKGEKAASASDLKGFEKSKLEDLLRAYKALNASGFGDDKKAADVGLAEPAATLEITLEDGAKRTLVFGSNAEGSSRWAKEPSKDQIYSVSSWAADWAFAEPKKFEKGPDDDKKPPMGGEGMPGMPMGMPGMPMGMPEGHP